MDAILFLKEKERMCSSFENCSDGCPLSSYSCDNVETMVKYAEKIVPLVEKWSEEHPRKTCLSVLLELFPNIILDRDGIPEFCPTSLGFKNFNFCNDGDCKKCWNQLCE